MGTLSHFGLKHILVSLSAIGFLTRAFVWYFGPAEHADEFFQVLEPAWIRVTGVGLETWEWRAGIRSWIFPGYHGAWMAFLRFVGINEGPLIGQLLQLHWAAIHTLLVPIGFRIGRVVHRRLSANRDSFTAGEPRDSEAIGGIIAAIFLAMYPAIVAAGPHTLTEVPSSILLCYGVILAADEAWEGKPRSHGGLLIGAVLTAAVLIRIAIAPAALAGPILLLLFRRWRQLVEFSAGAVIVLALFGLVDLFTWGRFLGSYFEYVEFNFSQGRAASFGTEPWWFYFEVIRSSAPISVFIILALLGLGIRGAWAFLLPAILLLVSLSSQAHKEERFIIALWPFLLASFGGVLGHLFVKLGRSRCSRAGASLLVAGLSVFVLAENIANLNSHHLQFSRVWLEGQAVAGRQDKVTTLLVERTYWSGGSMWFGRTVPQLNYEPSLLANPIVSHVLVSTGSENERQALAAGFESVFSKADVVLLARPNRQH